MKASMSWPYSFEKGFSLVDSTRKVIRFYDPDGKRSHAKEVRLRVSAAAAYDGSVFFKAFNRPQAVSYNVDKFVSSGGVYSIVLKTAQRPYDGEIEMNDTLVVAGSAGATNDGEYTVSSVVESAGICTIYVVESVTGQTGSSATIKNTVSATNAGSYLGSMEAERAIPSFVSEIHFYSVDNSGGALGSKVHLAAYSDERMNGATIA